MKKIRYMHTLDHRPATFDGNQIVFAVRTRPIQVCKTLGEIMKQRKRTWAYRRSQGYVHDHEDYGWMKVAV